MGLFRNPLSSFNPRRGPSPFSLFSLSLRMSSPPPFRSHHRRRRRHLRRKQSKFSYVDVTTWVRILTFEAGLVVPMCRLSSTARWWPPSFKSCIFSLLIPFFSPSCLFLSFLAIRSNRLRENAREAMSNTEDIVEAFPTPEADEVAGPVSEPPEYVTSKQLKVRTLQ